ncbi:2513_t:CDS:2 [Funneliformis mosseae]|uniref:2513_t:CDS:1 n=1 Tax=Funneliformis mosseae TaxID=27381 RepID=A0A9N9GVX2_FUNMO|nr:2513_t:CDS:2 [Funneliformis mosseae]
MSEYISVRKLKALKALNIDRELSLDHTQEEIEEILNILKSKLKHPITEVDINLYVLSDNSDIVKNLGSKQKNIFTEPQKNMKCALSDSVITNTSCSEQSEEIYIADVIIPLLQTSLSDLLNSAICLSIAEYQSIASKARKNLGIIEKQMKKKPDIMGLLKQDKKLLSYCILNHHVLCIVTQKNQMIRLSYREKH